MRFWQIEKWMWHVFKRQDGRVVDAGCLELEVKDTSCCGWEVRRKLVTALSSHFATHAPLTCSGIAQPIVAHMHGAFFATAQHLVSNVNAVKIVGGTL